MFQSRHIRTLTGEKLKQLRRILSLDIAAANRVVFLGGVQRSGTNLIMDLLEYSPDVKVFHERDTRAFDGEYCQQAESVIVKLGVSVLPCIVFKALSESYKIRHLMELFRDGRVIWVYRHYEPVVASNIALWPGHRNEIDKVVADPLSGDWRGLGMSETTLELLRAHYTPDLNEASAQALYWYYRNQLFFDQQLHLSPRALLVHYEAVLGDPAPELAKLSRFLEIRLPARAVSIIAPGPARVGEHVHDIAPPIRALCEDMLARLTRVHAGDPGMS